MNTKTDSKRVKKRRFKKRYWLLVDLAIAAVIFALLLYTPAGYDPADVGYKPGQIHPYLTYLSSEIYNNAQLREPFEVVVIESKLNEAIVSWSQMSDSIIISSPVIHFRPGCIELLVLADMKGVEFVVTIGLEPRIDETGLLNLKVTKVKVGAMNITPLARFVAERMYTQQLMETPIDTGDWRAKVAASLLNGEPFDPVFIVEDKQILLKKITLAEGKLELHLIPVP